MYKFLCSHQYLLVVSCFTVINLHYTLKLQLTMHEVIIKFQTKVIIKPFFNKVNETINKTNINYHFTHRNLLLNKLLI